MSKSKKIAFTGGSTGGHVMPLVSLIQALQAV
jgi:UDP-N-acetylglucosamine:LPS N-acetylglucosamine transferase